MIQRSQALEVRASSRAHELQVLVGMPLPRRNPDPRSCTKLEGVRRTGSCVCGLASSNNQRQRAAPTMAPGSIRLRSAPFGHTPATGSGWAGVPLGNSPSKIDSDCRGSPRSQAVDIARWDERFSRLWIRGEAHAEVPLRTIGDRDVQRRKTRTASTRAHRRRLCRPSLGSGEDPRSR